ncbi:MAG: hypothetical protein BWY43_00467 [candidate division WS2 bacterium ADurb.Bin280]|uniref:F5/8 type C domain protein n=1 Tax=candidate division WS2 bacterium ADurb.Bin280 TaxID=1852829 RepID=A0A1V5SDJ4_9BACT|nr:MAG: hypothetical protein BWY43_00467 [candidate division WS2 bacterium ADurb.Bin280]
MKNDLKAFSIIFLSLFLLVGTSFYVIFYFNKSNIFSKISNPVNGASAITQISSFEDFNIGTNVNTDLASSPGEAKINLSEDLEIDIQGIYNADNSRLTVSDFDIDKLNVFDGNTSIDNYWGSDLSNQEPDFVTITWTIHLDSAYSISKLRVIRTVMLGALYLETSSDGINFTSRGTTSGMHEEGWQEFTLSDVTATFIRLRSVGAAGAGEGLTWVTKVHEFEVYGGSTSATHTSAATQIDGGDNFIEWETFTPSQSVPENTTLTYRFRSSTDGAAWDSWSEYQTYSGSAIDISELVTSVSGEDKYRYLQVESKFTSSDGVSTPTLSEYTVGYHTNVAPSTPTAMTAVVGQ